MLGMPELNAAIVMDATLADVLVVAAKGDRPLPPRIAAWVEMCMNHGEKAMPAVVALHADGLEPEGAAAPLCSSLEGIAGRQGATTRNRFVFILVTVGLSHSRHGGAHHEGCGHKGGQGKDVSHEMPHTRLEPTGLRAVPTVS